MDFLKTLVLNILAVYSSLNRQIPQIEIIELGLIAIRTLQGTDSRYVCLNFVELIVRK